MTELAGTGAPDERYPGFNCFKTFRPIRYSKRWYRLGLVKAALDPDIRRMGPSPVAADKLPSTAEFAFWVSSGRGTRLIILTSGYIDTGIISARMPVQVQYRSDLSQGGAAAFAKAIWSCKRRVATPAEQLIAASICRKSPDGIEMGSLMREMSATLGYPITEMVESIFSMVANGLLETDVSLGLSPHAIVRQGPMSSQAGLVPYGRDATAAQLELFSTQTAPGTSVAF